METISRIAATAVLALSCLVPPLAHSGAPELRARAAELAQRLEHNPYGRPLAIDSAETDGALKGDVWVVFPHAFGHLASALSRSEQWCQVLMLPFNTKNCEAETADATRLTLFVGRKTETAIEDAYRIGFNYKVAARSADYLRVELDAKEGPMGTSGYRIVLEATPMDARRTFVHLRYGYAFGTMSRLAMSAYLSTAGASKVGFTTEGRGEDGKPRLVGGMRGVVERNIMRYALAIEAWLDACNLPEERRVARLTADWFTATEQYPRQLREIPRRDYLAMKEKEFARMKAS